VRGAVAALSAATLLAALGCMGPNSLGGSMSEVFPLDVSYVDILRNDDGFQVSYYNYNGVGIDLVAQVTVNLNGWNFTAGNDYPLQGEILDGGQRTAVLHLASDSPPEPLADVHLGDLQLNQGGNVGQYTQGSFSMSFVNDGGYGGGRDLYGNFSGQAHDAGYGDGNWPQ